jgi:excisionase family DNA binding protein
VYENRLVVSVREAAEITGYVESRIRRLISEGKLKAYRPGGKGDIRIFMTDLSEWLQGEGSPPSIRPQTFPNQKSAP